MNARELCLKLVDNVPERKLGYLMAYLQGLVADEADDLRCDRLVKAESEAQVKLQKTEQKNETAAKV